MKQEKLKVPISSGSYGCVYRPPITCIGDTQIIDYNDNVSKLLLKKDAQQEFEGSKIMQQLTNSDKIFIPIKRMCNPDLNEIEEKACKIYDPEYSNMFKLLIMKDGGNNLYDTKLHELFGINIPEEKCIENYNKLLDSYIEIINGLIELNDMGFVFQDVKDLNIVFNPKTFEMKLIDAGMLISKKNIKTNNGLEDWLYYPLYNIFYEIHKNENFYFLNLFNMFYEKKTFLYLMKNYYNNKNKTYALNLIITTLKKNKRVELEEKVKYMKIVDKNGYINKFYDNIGKNLQIMKNQSENFEEFLNNFYDSTLRVFDIFCFGIVIVRICVRTMNYKIHNSIKDKMQLLYKIGLDYMINPDQIEIIKNIPNLSNLIKGCKFELSYKSPNYSEKIDNQNKSGLLSNIKKRETKSKSKSKSKAKSKAKSKTTAKTTEKTTAKTTAKTKSKSKTKSKKLLNYNK